MSFYCMCEAKNSKPDSQSFGAPNRYCAAGPKDDFPPLALRRPMVCIKTGARQVILDPEVDHPNTWETAARPSMYREHYPNCDVFECPNCHSRVVNDGVAR